MAPIVYPLQEILEIKKRRVNEAEKAVQQKRRELELEQQKLRERETERNKVRKHKQNKLDQLRKEMDQGTTSPKIQQMKAYLDVVDQNLAVEEKKVEEQKKNVKAAEKNLEDAREYLRLKRLEVDKMETHKKDWTAEKKKELAVLEGRELDEIGNVTHFLHKRKV